MFIKRYLILVPLILATCFDLKGQEEDVEEVVVISSKVPVVLSEVIGSVALITQEDMEDRIVADIGDVLSKTVGVSVSTDTAYGRYYNDGVSIRGLGGTRVNILIDGIRVSDAYTGYGRDVVDPELLKKVEILKGPSSALYGSDGMAGAISYITKDPFDFVTGDGAFFSGTYAHHADTEHTKVAMLGGFAFDGVGAYIQVANRDRSEMELHDDITDSASNPFTGDGKSFISKVKYKFSETVALTVTFDKQTWSGDWILDTELGTSGAYFPRIITTTSSLGDDEGSRERLSFSYDFSGNSFFDVGSIKLYKQETDQQQITNKERLVLTMSNFGPPAPPMPMAVFRDFQFNQSISGITFEMNKQLKFGERMIHDIVYGFNTETLDTQRYRNSSETNLITREVSTLVDGEQYPGKTFPDTETVRTAFYLSDRVTLSESTTGVLGVRFDNHELNPNVDRLYSNTAVSTDVAEINDSETSLKVGLLQDLGDRFSAFVQYAEGFRSPDYESANLSFTNFARNYAIISNPNLESETSSGYEIGVRANFDYSRFSVAAYTNEYENFIDSAFAGFSNRGVMLFQYRNLDEVTIDGYEVSFDTVLNDNLDISFGYNSSNGEKNNENLTSINPAEMIVNFNWKSNNNRFKFSGYMTRFDQSTTGLPATCGRSGSACLTLPSYTIYDVFSSFKVNENITLKAGVRNLTDQKYWKWGSVNGLAVDAANLDLLSEPGTNVNASVNVRF